MPSLLLNACTACLEVPVRWQAIRPAIAKPWPHEAAVADLQWHRMLPGRMPGLGYFCGEWGWTAHKVRSLLVRERELFQEQA